MAEVDLASVAASFGHVLHSSGLPVTPERAGRFAEALRIARPVTTGQLYWTARVTLVGDHGQVAMFDTVFAQIFGGLVDEADSRGATPAVETRRPADRPPERSKQAPERAGGGENDVPTSAGAAGSGDEGDRDALLAAGSIDERLRHQDFASCTPEELELLRSLLDEMPFALPMRRGRRHRRDPKGGRIDRRSTLRRAQRTGGDPLKLVHRHPRPRPRRLVLLADVSGSMAPYSRAYLYLMHGAVRAARAEAFVFSTRLTRVTPQLRRTSPESALRAATAATPDWSGGTRIGEGLRTFLDEWGRRGMARGAVVVIVSDGWEVADPALVGEQMERLARLAHRIVWVNPRSKSDAYQPLAGGMAAALPFVDTFVSGHSWASLDGVVAALAT
jgi:uncharacterized protein